MADDDASVIWVQSTGLVAYDDAVTAMEAHVARIATGKASEAVWLLEHPPLYTAGTSAQDTDVAAAPPFPVFRTGRGGQYTYHGPGQRVAYVMLDVRRRFGDVRAFVGELEQWLIDALRALDVAGDLREGRVGVWVPRAGDPLGRDDKIAALGIRLRKWISFHGISLNVAPDLSHFDAIVPCGIREHGVTSLRALGANADMSIADAALRRAFEHRFGPTRDAPGLSNI
ncbi:MAG: lipoyl(octanoyl) transferase LipB [Pseudomonadota bacterium]